MQVDNLKFSPAQFLNLIESHGLTGTWGWQFADNQQVWSSGLYHLLGLDPRTTRPSYELLVGLVLTEDRAKLATGADLIQGTALGSQTVRFRRPDGAMRVLSVRNEIYFDPDGRPRGAAGVVLDVTDHESLRQARLVDQRRSRVLFGDEGTPSLFGDAALPFTEAPVPVDSGGGAEDWAGLTRSLEADAHPPGPPFDEALDEALDGGIDGRHLRAARALLDWSMTDLAKAAGLSLSTVKRMEEHLDNTAQQSRHKAVETLRKAGIRFSRLDGGVIGIGHREVAST
ncbi:hypothetical protein ASG51_04600 [Methylobacterium sp. Leaf465]|uniref:PAS domain-containing protein n=1 Tax=Methylobacterium sp. Leaf465 TaxID=1736385 RepID=UPI0006F4ABBE|nr:PAS domain-containing protein [Methylobacterium sp. Leaf465]KQT79910.1 hypothetical protein ASG51_04600 [Methylobacterium sp. Leaf465]